MKPFLQVSQACWKQSQSPLKKLKCWGPAKCLIKLHNTLCKTHRRRAEWNMSYIKWCMCMVWFVFWHHNKTVHTFKGLLNLFTCETTFTVTAVKIWYLVNVIYITISFMAQPSWLGPVPWCPCHAMDGERGNWFQCCLNTVSSHIQKEENKKYMILIWFGKSG